MHHPPEGQPGHPTGQRINLPPPLTSLRFLLFKNPLPHSPLPHSISDYQCPQWFSFWSLSAPYSLQNWTLDVGYWMFKTPPSAVSFIVFEILKQALPAIKRTTRSQARWRTRRKKHRDPAYGRECREPRPWRGKPRSSPQNCGISLRKPFRSTGCHQGGVRLFGVPSGARRTHPSNPSTLPHSPP